MSVYLVRIRMKRSSRTLSVARGWHIFKNGRPIVSINCCYFFYFIFFYFHFPLDFCKSFYTPNNTKNIRSCLFNQQLAPPSYIVWQNYNVCAIGNSVFFLLLFVNEALSSLLYWVRRQSMLNKG